MEADQLFAKAITAAEQGTNLPDQEGAAASVCAPSMKDELVAAALLGKAQLAIRNKDWAGAQLEQVWLQSRGPLALSQRMFCDTILLLHCGQVPDKQQLSFPAYRP